MALVHKARALCHRNSMQLFTHTGHVSAAGCFQDSGVAVWVPRRAPRWLRRPGRLAGQPKAEHGDAAAAGPNLREKEHIQVHAYPRPASGIRRRAAEGEARAALAEAEAVARALSQAQARLRDVAARRRADDALARAATEAAAQKQAVQAKARPRAHAAQLLAGAAVLACEAIEPISCCCRMRRRSASSSPKAGCPRSAPRCSSRGWAARRRCARAQRGRRHARPLQHPLHQPVDGVCQEMAPWTRRAEQVKLRCQCMCVCRFADRSD